MALPVSPAFDTCDMTTSPPSRVAQQLQASQLTRAPAPHPLLRSRSEPQATSLRSLALSYANNNPATVRQLRQRAVRSQSCASHLREISELVKRMVDNEEQCSVNAISLTPSTNSYRSRSDSDATTESVASSSMCDRAAFGFDDETDASYSAGADAAMGEVEEEEELNPEADYHHTTEWLVGRMAKCSVGKDGRVHKPRRTERR